MDKFKRVEKQISRCVELHKEDIIYFNTETMKEIGYDYDLILREVILLKNFVECRVVKIFKTKKKWWQFCKKVKVTGYHLEVL